MDAGGAVQFGPLLRQARKKRGLSQSELGGDRYSGSYISHLESGRRLASPEVIEFLSRRLGVSLLEWGTAAPGGDSRWMTRDGGVEDLMVAERAWSDRDFGSAIAHSKQAAESAAASGDSTRHWEALYVMAQARFAAAEYAEAAQLAEELAEHQTAQRFSVARAQALSLASIANRASDRLGWAIAFGARAVEAASAAPPIILSEALMALVSAMSEAGHPPAEAQPFLDRLARLAPRLTSDHSRGMIAWTQGAAAFVAGNPTAGLRFQEEAAKLLDQRRDLRLWLRFHSTAASWRLGAGITDGVPELLKTAAFGLQMVGNSYDMVELRQAEAKLALITGDAEHARSMIQAVLDDPVYGAPEMALGQSQLLLAQCLSALGKEDAARRQFAIAAMQLEAEGRLRAAVDAWRSSAGQQILTELLTTT